MPGAHHPTSSINSPQKQPVQSELESVQHATVEAEAATHGLPIVAAVCTLNAAMSIPLISFNKYLMHEGRFPYPLPLVTGHCALSSFLIAAMWLLHRWWGNTDSELFSSLPEFLRNTTALKRRIVIISLFYALQLVVTNAAYLYSSMVFIQMMKEANIVLVYLASIVVALEAISLQRFKALCVIVFATFMTIKGELNFTWFGFCVQGAGQIFEVGRIVLQALLLCGSAKIDVFSYVLFVAPVSTVFLGGVLFVNSNLAQPHSFNGMPTWSIIMEWWPVLLVNALLAFALTITTAMTVKYASAMGLILSGVLKDTCIIIFGAFFFREHVSILQVIGFSLQMIGILAYSLAKLHPDKFVDGFFHGIKSYWLSLQVKRPSTPVKRYGSVPLSA